ncbi:hypothetical protein AMECASPLE_003035 [Ameca splendens]|uniref:Uncharacterized protein n=1 Tax=Ameca splendens TaxID=208324 RepID=A0ABV0Z951_9TELE
MQLSTQFMVPSAAPDHHTTTTMVDCCNDVLSLNCCFTFTPDVIGCTSFRRFHFGFVSPQNTFQKQVYLAKVRQFFVLTLVNHFFFHPESLPFLPSFYSLLHDGHQP